MAFVPAPNIVMAEVRALLDGQHIENRFMLNAQEAVTPAIVQSIATSVLVWATAEYFPLLPNAVALVEVFARDLTTADGSQYSATPAIATVGGQASIPMPNETTFCVSFRSTASGRSARGRAFVLALPQPLVVGNIINATLRGQLVDAFNALRTQMDTDGTPLTIVSYVNGGIPRPGGPVYYPVVNCVSVDNVVDSQRRRKPGNGS